MSQQESIEVAMPPRFNEADADEAVALFAQAFEDADVEVKKASDRMAPPVLAGPFYDFGISVAASIAAQILWSLVASKKAHIQQLYDKLGARFKERDVHIYIRIIRPDETVITYRLPQDQQKGHERIELIIAQLDMENPNRLTM